MQNLKFRQKLVAFILALIFLAACMPPVSKTPRPEETNLPPIVPTSRQNSLTATLLAEWKMGNVEDMAWSPDSKMVAVNYWLDGDDSNNFVQAFSVESLKSIWIVENSLAWNLVFTPDGQFIVESNTNVPFFYWRNVEQGQVVRQGEFTNLSQIKLGDCNGGGQILITNTHENTALIADYGNLLGPRTNNIVAIRQLDFETGKCKNLFDYQGSFDLFDLNAGGSLLAYGGEGEDDSVVIWDMEEQTEVCRTHKVGFGRFVPGENTLAVVRDQKITFIDASTCQEMGGLNMSPASDYENYLAFSPDGKLLAVARDSIQIIKVSAGETLAQIPFPEKAIPISNELFLSGMKFSPNGRFLLIAYYLLDGADDGEIQLWQLSE